MSVPVRRTARLTAWTRKVHNYVGLFLLCFLWLFAGSGLLLNHPTWTFAQFWPDRVVTSRQAEIRRPAPGDPVAQARDLMRQVGVAGEIEGITPAGGADSGLHVRVVKPGRITDIEADLGAGRATIEQTQTNLWGVIQWLHHFSGVRLDRPQQRRDWAMTGLWSLTMDAICVGLIFLVASGFVIWYPQVGKRRPGWAFLGAGTLVCGLFVFGLSWVL